MDKMYRVYFFDRNATQATAVLVLHFDSDKAAEDEALQILSASALSRVEIWQGTRLVCGCAPARARETLAACAFRV